MVLLQSIARYVDQIWEHIAILKIKSELLLVGTYYVVLLCISTKRRVWGTPYRYVISLRQC